MRIVFGQRNFKIREFNSHEFGFTTQQNNHFDIEIRQSYFHIYWIPFFGTGKIWAIKRDGQLYELPTQYIHEIKRRQKIRSPWYTYTWPILISLGFLIYFLVEQVKESNYQKQNIKYFTENVQLLGNYIDNATVNEFFTLQDTKEDTSDSKMYLKVEKVYADRILFTLIPGFFLNSTQSELEDCYNDNKANLDTISISKAALKNAINKDYDASKTYNYKGENLLKSDKLYVLVAVEKKFQPQINIAQTYNDYKVIQIELTNSSTAFKIVSIKNVTNSIPWNTKLPFEVAAGTKSKPTKFILENTESDNFSFYNNKDYSVEVTILDSNNIEHSFLIKGNGSSNFIFSS